MEDDGTIDDDGLSNADSDCSSDSCSDDNPIIAPPFSPMLSTEDESNIENPECNQQDPTTEILEPSCNDGNNDMPTDGRVWNGFKLVGDNIDKNYRRSFNRMDKKPL